MADELFNQLMARVPDPQEYENADMRNLIESSPVRAEVPMGPALSPALLKVLSSLPASIKASRPAAALIRQLSKPIDPKSPEMVFRQEKIGRYQPPKTPITPPEGFALPPPSPHVPSNPIAQRVLSERAQMRKVQENLPKVGRYGQSRSANPIEIPKASGDPLLAAKALPVGQAPRRLTHYEMKAQGLEGYARKGTSPLTNYPKEFLDKVLEMDKTWVGKKTDLAKKLGISESTLFKIRRLHK